MKDAPVVATRVMIDGEEMIELDPSLLKDTVIFPLSYFTEKLEIIKLDDRDEALTGAPYAYVSDHGKVSILRMWEISGKVPENIDLYMPLK